MKTLSCERDENKYKMVKKKVTKVYESFEVSCTRNQEPMLSPKKREMLCMKNLLLLLTEAGSFSQTDAETMKLQILQTQQL